MKAWSITLSMSSNPAPVTVTDKTKLQLPIPVWVAIFLAILSTGTAAGGAWFTLRSDVIRQGAAIEANRLEAQRGITELRTETKEQLSNLTGEQKIQRELLIRIDENVKRLPRDPYRP